MNILNRVEIYGLWDERNLSLDFHPDVNFLIGANGSGKTTVINLIAAALNADFPTLDRLSFNRIKLQLSQPHSNRKPIIDIEKTQTRQPPFFGINYRIRNITSEKPADYSLDSYEEQLSLRNYPTQYSYYRGVARRANLGVVEHLKRLVNISWLSIHRSESRKRPREEAGYESTVDSKLEEISNDLVRYFSLLERRGANLTDNFQQKVFLSLIPVQRSDELIFAVQELDREAERTALIDIFHSFGLDDRSFADGTANQFKLLDEAREKIKSGAKMIDLEHFGSIVHAMRIHSLVQEWNELLQSQQAIYEPRDTFLSTLNTMLKRKNIQISEKNELIANMYNGPTLSVKQLSSGEKQLLIILGEALLQEKQAWIYIADEPELSLHVDWQEQLVDNLRQVNPNAQTIFATHSPDIVSHYSNKVFDMESYIP